ncbi:MAG: cupin domain-containing protein [Planctomycetaceae bacterium]|nr:cupin domain-containing protein [Planctomycetaceae bacterium]
MTDNKQNGYTCYESGPMAEWYERHVVQHPKLGAVRGKKWLKEELQLTGMEVSVGVMAPGQGMSFSHAHKQNEELYLFLAGNGEMLLDGTCVPVSPGSAVRVAPPVSRAWRNTGAEPLYYLVIQARADSLQQWTASDGIVTGGDPWT